MININVITFKKEVTDVYINMKWPYYRSLWYTKKNLSKRTVRGIYFGSLFPTLQIRMTEVQGMFIKTTEVFAANNPWSIQSKTF